MAELKLKQELNDYKRIYESNPKQLIEKIIPVSFLISISGAIMKINHMDGAEILLIISFVVSLGYIVIGIYEVNSSNKIKQSEKVMWIFGFVFISLVAGLVYILNG